MLKALVGERNVNADVQPTMGAEDFAFMLQAKPGCYVFIGNGPGEGAACCTTRATTSTTR